MQVWSLHLMVSEPSCGRWQPDGCWGSSQAGQQSGSLSCPWAIWLMMACGTEASWRWWSACSFSVSWCGESFHGLGIQCADVSAHWCFTSAKCVSASQQGPSFPELTQSESVSQSPFWILFLFHNYFFFNFMCTFLWWLGWTLNNIGSSWCLEQVLRFSRDFPEVFLSCSNCIKS
jgi:hypothetical protein